MAKERRNIVTFLFLLLVTIFLAFLSNDTFLLAFVNISFLIGLFLLIIGSIIIIFAQGTFDIVRKGINQLRRSNPRYSKEEQALMDYGFEEVDEDEIQEKRKGQGKLGSSLLIFGLLYMGLSLLSMLFL